MEGIGCCSRWMVVVPLFLAMLFGLVASESQMTAYWDDKLGQVYAVEGLHEDGLAWASFDDLVNTTGWARLTIVGNERESDEFKKAKGMGYLEGYMTADRIYDAYYNIIHSSNPLPDHVIQFAADQLAWMKQQVDVWAPQDSTYWLHVGFSLAQLEGMAAGYNNSRAPKLTFDQFYQLTNAGDLEDLVHLPNPSQSPSPPTFSSTLTSQEEDPIWDRAGKSMECSGLIKIVPDGRGLYAGHTTFNAFSYMLRIFKHYTFNIRGFATAAQTVSFSSRPGDLESKDDFYLLDSGLVVMETSLAVFNGSLYNRLSPSSVPCWVRVNLANRWAKSADKWSEYFAMFNSGTHNNQWLVLDYKLFNGSAYGAGQPLAPNTVWMVEQMPGVVALEDITFLLQSQHYVPSYNIPYFDDIFNISGYRAAGYSYSNDPRARMFKAYSPLVRSPTEMAHFMNSNDYAHDPLSLGNPCNAISARCDIQTSNPSAFGGIDSKMTTDRLWREQMVVAISGPSYQNEPVFKWEPTWASVAHRGMPNTWQFDWQSMSPYPSIS